MMNHLVPQKQGLYHPAFEHDNCGVGLIVNLKNNPSHQTILQGLSMLCRLNHRGGQGSDPDTGDGAGIMLQICYSFFVKVCQKEGIILPAKGQVGVGMLFLPHDPNLRTKYEQILEQIISLEGQTVLGWRTVPVDPTKISSTAKNSQPFIRQIFIGASEELKCEHLAFERKLYVIRKQFELQANNDCYVASLSSETIVYKGLLTPKQLADFYQDLQNEENKSSFAMVHSRFSTNTFPSWERAHPNRYLIHNGEINTLKGNVHWMRAREKMFQSEDFGEDLNKVFPILHLEGSDSTILDNCFEFLTLSGRSLAHTAMMLIPEPWEETNMSETKRAFYEFHSCLMEPWDGPTAIIFTNGRQIGAMLDRNGLRPVRYYVTSDDQVILASEVGVVDVPENQIVEKGRLQPGEMFYIDLEEQRMISDVEIKEMVSQEYPYQQWISEGMIRLEKDLSKDPLIESSDDINLSVRQWQKIFGYTQEELSQLLAAMVSEGKDPIGSMGYDAPLAVLSDRPQLLYNYFKQSFAQVTNPPIDALREACVTSTTTMLGAEGNLLQPNEASCRRIRLQSPLLSRDEFIKLHTDLGDEFRVKTFDLLFSTSGEDQGLEEALHELFQEVDQAICEGNSMIILSDRRVNEQLAAMPVLLAVSGLHHYLIQQGSRMKASLIVDTGEARDVHQFSMLLGCGADAIHPYLGIASLEQLVEDGQLDVSLEEVEQRYLKAANEGIVKVMSKMGISTVQSYRGAQIFEAIGIGPSVIDQYFPHTSSQLGGIGLESIAQETILRHRKAFEGESGLESGSDFQYRRDGEYHAFQPKVVHALQKACRQNSYDLYQQYSELATRERKAFLRDLLDITPRCQAVPLDEVESVDEIVRRFKTGAMSYGSLSKEAHETLAIAMNRLGAKSNSGEGGEDPRRFVPDAEGNLKRSAIKQVASGRFGVTSHYLVNADEIQIKMAQGAKPGEGGQLPGSKVVPWIAEVRGSTPGIGLISPPPHHDIYSIEDLAQLIYDLKNANPHARISVKLVAKSGVGTIATGVAKGLADVIVISGHDGGTGASPKTSIKHAGVPWELGLAETHQTLLLNQLRDRVVLEVDGKMMTGRDVVIAALLGAEEYGFATAPLVSIGCVMARVCHKDTCPVGIATQKPNLRKRFKGDPEHTINFMRFVAQEVREIMASLGFRTMNEMIGRTDLLQANSYAQEHWKAKHLDFGPLLYQPSIPEHVGRYHQRSQDHKLLETLDYQKLLPLCAPALEKKEPLEKWLSISNTNRAVGTLLGSKLTQRFGAEGLPDGTIHLHFQGSAGQSFGAFIPKGITLSLEGDANDYVGKGLSGGTLIVKPSPTSSVSMERHVIIGNVAFYGATSGEAYICGSAGERFAVRNSGVQAVVEGVGDHGCEYMTGGRVVILGGIGKNFAAGMSGGIAYILANDTTKLSAQCNLELVEMERLLDDSEVDEVKKMVEKHCLYTGSSKGKQILTHWDSYKGRFVKIIPKDFKKITKKIHEMKQSGLEHKEAMWEAFQDHTNQKIG